MKIGVFAFLALACVIGLAYGQFGFPQPAQTQSSGSGYLGIGAIGLLLLLLLTLTRSKSVPLYVNNITTGVNVPITVGGFGGLGR